ncbi:MAG: hypothetical protein J7513_15340 [Solirubrobacteraceae bacterium]|nr:hypothetical protein [Solirubrobacteraceae bacterium]
MPTPAFRVAATVFLSVLSLAGTAHAATMDVARRVEPTLDRFLFTENPVTPLSAMTPAQQYLATHANPLVLHDSDSRVSQYVTGWAKAPRTAAYRNGTGVNLGNAPAMAETKAWQVTEKGKPVLVDGGWQMLDLRVPAARTWWLYGADGKASCNPSVEERGALDLYACGYKSIWIDNALTTPKQGFTPTPTSIPEKSWATAVLTLLKQLKAKKPAGTTFTINMHWTDTSFGYASNPKLKATDPAVRAGKYADQVIVEGGAIDAGIHYPFAARVPWSYRRLLTFADAMHKRGTKLQWEMTSSVDLTRGRTPVSSAPQLPALPDCRDDAAAGVWTVGSPTWKGYVQAAAFNWSTAVLSWKKGDGVGDMCIYPDRGWVGYTANLGKPTGKRVDKKGLLTRKLQRGYVVLNPNDTAKRVKLPKAGVNLASTAYPQPTAKVRAVVIPPRSAAVIQY